MAFYTLRPTWPNEPSRPDDYEFRRDGKDVGRCYLRQMAGTETRWHWTVYGTNLSGDEVTLDAATTSFRRALEGSI